MGIADEADRTLFVGNLDPQVTEEVIFELFLQAGPLIKVKIPKDSDGKSKQFAFVNFKHEVSVPYALNMLNGIRLYGRQLNIQFRAGSSHISQEGKSPANSQNPSPANTPGHRGGRTPEKMGSPPYSPPQHIQRSFSSPDSLQRQAMMNNMWQVQMQQVLQLNGGLQQGMQQLRSPADSNHWQHDRSGQRGPRHFQQDNNNPHGRDQRHGNSGNGYDRHRRDSQRGDFYHHDDRSGGHNRNHPPERRRDSREGRWKPF
ncbi:RNA-binding protein 7-like isoform X2 [Sinocyclocheilus rhinocerous]|uniref:RNA-binding protein 7-like n=1 Tax=Sinocyclocheilus rhinocerous TaxID=307959 RepID=A0A673NKH3_9TELE|nr:PREDICTED: RNA-binding protein 7-like isoform X1 [Sinocyclocheilus rhinocerous]XP_016428053.1 PREDICTED: RNA-binding protein 7-like isoform X2 [Sinocyclocheilus rhinocerous]